MEIYFLTVLQAASSRSWCQHCLVSGGHTLAKMASFSLCPHMAEDREQALWCLFLFFWRHRFYWIRIPPLWNSFYLNWLPKGPIFETITGRGSGWSFVRVCSGYYDVIPQTGVLTQQKFISHNLDIRVQHSRVLGEGPLLGYVFPWPYLGCVGRERKIPHLLFL